MTLHRNRAWDDNPELLGMEIARDLGKSLLDADFVNGFTTSLSKQQQRKQTLVVLFIILLVFVFNSFFVTNFS